MNIPQQIYQTLADHLTEKLKGYGYYILSQDMALDEEDTELYAVWANEADNKALMLSWDVADNIYELQVNRNHHEPDINDMDWETLEVVNYANQELDANDHDFAIEKLVHAYQQEVEQAY